MNLSLAVKLASLVIHCDEAFGPGGHHFDKIAIQQIIEDPEVKQWLRTFEPGTLPVKRS